MPLPDWLKQHDDVDEPQPAAAAREPEQEPDQQAPEAPPPAGAELQDLEPEAPEPAAPEPATPEPEDEAPAPRQPARQVVVDEAPPTGNDQVLGMLGAIEQQLRKLGDVQRQHEDQLASLIDRSTAAAPGPGEDDEQEPQSKQPSFVVEMDEGEPAAPEDENRHDLQDMASELETSRQQTDQMRQQLEEAQACIKELSASADGDGEDQAQELAEAYEKIEALQSRVIELEAVASVGAEDDDDEDDGKDEQIAELTAQVAELQHELRAREAAEPPPVPAPPPDSAGAEMIERQRKQIKRLTEQLATVSSGSDPMELQQRDARIAELEEELEELRDNASKQGVSKLVAGFGGALRQVRGKKGGGDPEEVAELEQRIAELEVECQQLRQAGAGAGPMAGSGDESEEVAALRARVAELERNPAAAGGELRSKVETEFRQKWAELKQKQDDLAAAEERMRRKWARPQAVVVLGWLSGLAIVVAILSWLLAGRMFPPTIAASVSIEAKTRTGVPVADDEKAAWQEVHTAMLGNEAFVKTVSSRLADQRYDDYKDPDELADRLEDDLTVDSPAPGAITLTLAGKNRRDTTAVLDTLATSLATWSAQQAGKRGDNAVADVRGERREKGHVRYASIHDEPIRDRRVFGALFLFVVGFIISYFLITRISQGLMRAKSAMEEDEFGVTTDVF